MHDKIAAIMRLKEIIDVLRGPQGCPWDRAQTLSDMGRYVLEESSEVADAIDVAGGGPAPAVCEELGDLLMNVFLAAKIAEDSGSFSIAEVADGISEKLVRRHPHVFGNATVNGVDEVLTRWDAIKAKEKETAASVKAKTTAKDGAATSSRPAAPSRLDGVPRSLPPLERSYEIGKKAAKVGFDWPDAEGALGKVEEELEEVRHQIPRGPAAVEEELGDLLFAVVNLCRKLDIRPDTALRRTIAKFCERFRTIEDRIADLEKATLEEMESVWQEAKSAAGKEGGRCP